MENNKASTRKIIILIVVAVIISFAVVYFLDKQKPEEAEKLRQASIKLRFSSQIQRELCLLPIRNSYDEAKERVFFLKNHIENRDGYKSFYDNDGNVRINEKDIHNSFDLTWFGSSFYVAKNVNNGRGAADFVISRGAENITVIEFKLASSSKLKNNLKNQTKIYELANNTTQSIKVILFFSDKEERKVNKIIGTLGLEGKDNVILIDARNNKTSASNIV